MEGIAAVSRTSPADSAMQVGPSASEIPFVGLSAAEATSRLARDGPNALPMPPPRPWWRALAAQLVHFFALMLWVAAALAVLAGLAALGVAIVLVILANASFAFIQEHRAERAAERLRELLPRRVLVFRDGTLDEVEADRLVA